MVFGMLSVVQGFSYWWGWGRRVALPPTNWKIAHPLTRKTPPPPSLFSLHTLCTQVMLILILMDVQYLQNVVFTFGKGLNNQSYSLSGSHHMIKKVPLNKVSHPPSTPLIAIWKTLSFGSNSLFLTDFKIVIYWGMSKMLKLCLRLKDIW